MTEEKQNLLYERYPKIFKQKDMSPQESCMHWGICVGDGWFDILDKLCHALQFHADKNSYPQVVANQVKEKFGGLRFYYHVEETEDSKNCKWDRPASYLDGMIDFACAMAAMTCESCGAKAQIGRSGSGWVTCLCDDCKKQYDARFEDDDE